MNDTRPLLSIETVSKRFRSAKRPAIDSLSAVVPSGQIVGVVGADGAGKTTLMRLIAGLLLPDQGRIFIAGFDTRTQLDEVRNAVAYMPQRFGLYEDLSVLENLDLYADLRRLVGSERKGTFNRLLAFTGLHSFLGRKAGALSGGMKQKLGLACALLRPPRLLLLDEPTVGVDPLSRRELWRMVLELKDKGIGILWSTAYLDEAEKCDTVLLLNDGAPLFVGRPSELMDRVSTRTFSVSSGTDRRAAMSDVTKQPQIIDATFEGSQIRVLLADKIEMPAAELSRTLALQPRAARFEDGFMAILGGMHKETCRLNRSPDPTSGKEDDIRVEAVALTRRFGSFTAADHVSFAIKRGEIFGLIGPNGAGKSTVFKMLCGLLRPTAGRALVDGLDLAKAPGAARARLGYMAQRFSLYGDLSVRQNLEFFARTYGVDRVHLRGAIDNAIDALNLKDYETANAGSLPLGFKQRLALACAIIHQPHVLFLDEPTSGVDPITRRDFWFHINELATRGVTVLVTTHFLDEAEYCDRMAFIYRGRVIAADTPAQIREYGRTPDRPSPTLDDAFTSLVASYDREQAA